MINCINCKNESCDSRGKEHNESDCNGYTTTAMIEAEKKREPYKEPKTRRRKSKGGGSTMKQKKRVSKLKDSDCIDINIKLSKKQVRELLKDEFRDRIKELLEEKI